MATLSVGIDLGSDNVKLICLLSSKGTYELVSHALIRKNNMHTLLEFLAHPDLKNASLRIAIQDPNLKVQKLKVPVVPREEMEQAVTWTLKEAVEMPIDDYTVRYYDNLSQSDAKTVSVTAIAMEKKKIADWLHFMSEVGIANPSIAEPDIQSLANAVNYNYELKESDRYAVIDIGKAQTQCVVLSSNGIEFYRPFSGVCGNDLTMSLSHDLNTDHEESERMVLEVSNNLKCSHHDEVQEVIGRFCAKFCVQAQYAIENYMGIAKDKPITNVLLSGGGANLKGLKEQIQETLHHPTDLIDPFIKLNCANFDKKEYEGFKTLYSVAAGLAL